MSLPKRDGINDRYYLIHKPDTSPEVLAEADLCIRDMLNGTARENHSAYPTVVRNHNGTPFLPDQLLERYLTGLLLKKFPCEDAVSVCDAMRRLVGWEEIRYTLEKYIEKQVQERFFLVGERDDGFTVFPPCTVLPELRPEDVDEGLLHFACYVAVCCTMYGQSFESLTAMALAELYFQWKDNGKLDYDHEEAIWDKVTGFTASKEALAFLLRQLTDIKNEVPDEDGIREIVDLWKNEDSGEIAPAWPEHLDWLIKRLISEQEA